ncbi:MAG TPA: SIMPL domain-containing protein, partial [Fastidiosipila sp.]|nr:SIMPL domain-containing protein [Fastidiosipila sp.]
MKTITVRGQGSYAAKPDYVELTLVLEARATDYDEAMAAAAVQLEQIDS